MPNKISGLREPNIVTKWVLDRVIKKIPQENYIAEGILPNFNVGGEKTLWEVVKGDFGMAKFVAPNEEAPLIDEDTIEQHFESLAYIRNKKRLDETDLETIREAGELPINYNAPVLRSQATNAENKVRRILGILKNRVLRRVEWMRWQALQGRISYNDGASVKFCIDYGLPPSNLVTASPAWCTSACTTSGNILCDLERWIDQYTFINGFPPTRIYGSRKVLRWMSLDAGIRDILKQSQYATTLSAKNITTAIKTLTGLTFEVVSGFWSDDQGTTKSFFLPDNRLILMGEPRQGDEILGDVAVGSSKASNWKPGLFTWREEEKDPWVTYIGAGIMGIPRIFHPEWIFVATICDTTGVGDPEHSTLSTPGNCLV